MVVVLGLGAAAADAGGEELWLANCCGCTAAAAGMPPAPASQAHSQPRRACQHPVSLISHLSSPKSPPPPQYIPGGAKKTSARK